MIFLSLLTAVTFDWLWHLLSYLTFIRCQFYLLTMQIMQENCNVLLHAAFALRKNKKPTNLFNCYTNWVHNYAEWLWLQLCADVRCVIIGVIRYAKPCLNFPLKFVPHVSFPTGLALGMLTLTLFRPVLEWEIEIITYQSIPFLWCCYGLRGPWAFEIWKKRPKYLIEIWRMGRMKFGGIS